MLAVAQGIGNELADMLVGDVHNLISLTPGRDESSHSQFRQVLRHGTGTLTTAHSSTGHRQPSTHPHRTDTHTPGCPAARRRNSPPAS